MLANSYAEDEFIIDRRRLRHVKVLKRYSEHNGTPFCGAACMKFDIDARKC
jgi:hypothetical protein